MRTVRERGVRQVPWLWGGKGHTHACSFCSIRVAGGIVEHRLCPGTVKDGSGKGKDWTCACAAAGHPATGNPAHRQGTIDIVECEE